MMKKAYTDLPTIGDTILAWREFMGLRSTEFAKLAGISKGYLSAVEHNKRANPQPKYLEKIADALDVSLEDILGRQMPPKKRDRKKLKRTTGPTQSPKQPTTPQPTMAGSALALPDSLLYLTFAQIEARIESRDLSDEQLKRIAAGLIDASDLLLDMIKPQHEKREED
jgi:transcriptional regulator with XRE-family HTH domain